MKETAQEMTFRLLRRRTYEEAKEHVNSSPRWDEFRTRYDKECCQTPMFFKRSYFRWINTKFKIIQEVNERALLLECGWTLEEFRAECNRLLGESK